MSDTTRSWGLLVARFLLAPIFILSGTMKVFAWSETTAHMTHEGMSAVPVLLALAILFEIVGGLALLIGYKAHWAALALVVFLLPTTLIFHDFWAYEGMEQQNQMQHFLKNLTIIGGLLTLAAAGAGRFALDEWGYRARARRQASRTIGRGQEASPAR